MKKSFTLMELIFSIVILGISAGITFKYIVDIYTKYQISKEKQDLGIEIDLTLTQIGNRLENRVPDTVIASNKDISPKYYHSSDIEFSSGDYGYNVLEWIGYDYEGNIGEWNDTLQMNIGWSGFIDCSSPYTKTTQFYSPDSYFSAVDEIIDSLSNSECNLTNRNCVGLIFDDKTVGTNHYGWYGGDNSSVVIVDKNESNDSMLKLFVPKNMVYPYYKLAWSAYAIEHNTSNGELYLYYNYRPWLGEEYAKDGEQVVLDRDVYMFRFASNTRNSNSYDNDTVFDGSLIKITLCKRKKKDSDETLIHECRTRTIF